MIYRPQNWTHEEQLKHILSCPPPDDPYWSKRWWKFWKWFT